MSDEDQELDSELDPIDDFYRMKASLAGCLYRAISAAKRLPGGTKAEPSRYARDKAAALANLREALKLLGVPEEPVIVRAELQEIKGRRYVILADQGEMLYVSASLEPVALGKPVTALRDLHGPYTNATHMAVEMGWVTSQDKRDWQARLDQALSEEEGEEG